MKASKIGFPLTGIALFLSLLFFTSAKGQLTLWSDDFSTVGNGATSGNNWRVLSTTDCDPQPSVFHVEANVFTINDMEGSGCSGSEGGSNDNLMQIGPIDVTSANCLQVGYTLEAQGSFETTGNGADQLLLTISIDGTVVRTDAYLTDGPIVDQGPKVINIPNSGNTLYLTIQGGNQSVDEFYYLSSIYVDDISFTPSISDFAVCQDEVFDLNQISAGLAGVWTGQGVVANQWSTYQLESGTSYDLQFDPQDPCGKTVNVKASVIGGKSAGSGSTFSCSTGDLAIFDLTQVEDLILAGESGDVYWFEDENKQVPIADPSGYESTNGEIVYGAFLDEDNCLSKAGPITLLIQEPESIEPIDDVVSCGPYVLPALDSGLQYEGYDAEDTIRWDTTVVVSKGSGTCSVSTSFTVTILTAPHLDAYPGPTEACDSLELPEISGADLSGNQAYYTQPGGSGIRLEAGSLWKEIGDSTLYFYDDNGTCSAEDSIRLSVYEVGVLHLRDTVVCDTFAFPPYNGPGGFQGYFSEPNGKGTQYQPGEGMKRGPGTVRYYGLLGEGSCTVEDSFDITFRLAPDLVTISGFQDCDTFRLPEIGGDNLSGNEAYFLQPGGQGPSLPAGTLIEESTTFYVYDRIGSCPDELILPVIIIPTPKLNPLPDTVVCDQFTLPEIEGDRLTGSQAYWTQKFGQGQVYTPGEIITNSHKLYLYDDRAGCTDQDSFELTVNIRPQIFAPIGQRYLCDTFSLPALIGSDLTGNEVMSTQPFGQGDTLSPGHIIADSMTVYIYGGKEGCRVEDSLELFINAQPILFPQEDIETCDYWVLPPIEGLNLTGNVSYYDAPEGLGEAYSPGDTIYEGSVLYLYDFTEIGCFAEDTFNLQIGITPQLSALPDTLACGSFTLPDITGQNLQFPAYLNDPFEPTQFFTAGQTLMGDQLIYLYDSDQGCIDTSSFLVQVIPQVEFEPLQRDTMVCDSFILAPLRGENLTGNEAYFDQPYGQGNRFEPGAVIRDSMQLFLFDARETCTDQDTLNIFLEESPILDALPDIFACDYYVLPELTGQNLTSTAAYFDTNSRERFLPGDTIYTNRSMEAVDSNIFGCISIASFKVVITPKPQLASVANQQVCDRLILPKIEGRFLPASVGYFTDSLGSGFRLNPGEVLEVSQRVYLFADTLGCRDEASFDLRVNYSPRVTNAPTDTTACISFDLPVLSGRDLSGNTAYYDQPEGRGRRINLPIRLESDTILYLYGNNGSCYLRDTISIAVNQIAADLIVTDSIECYGGRGQVELQNVVAESALEIHWSNSAWEGQRLVSDLAAGTYGLSLTDSDNCTLEKSISLSQPQPLLLNCSILQQVSVPNGLDGQVQLTIQGGTAPYTLVFSGIRQDTLVFPGPADFLLDSLSAGSISIRVVDKNGCTQSCTQTIVAPPCELSVAIQKWDITCAGANDGRIETRISNAQAPFTLDWKEDQWDGLFDLDQLAAGNYALSVTDANACTDSVEVRINQPEVLSFEILSVQTVSNESAHDGGASISFAGGTGPYQLIYHGPLTDTFTFSSPSSLEIDSLPPGIYNVHILDANRCQAAGRFTISNPFCGMQIDFAKVDQQCPNTADGSLVTLIEGGMAPFQYYWEDGSRDSFRNDLKEGIYQLSVIDSDHCVVEVADTINLVNPLPAIAFLGDTLRCDSACQSFDLGLSGSAPFTFSWTMTRTEEGQERTTGGFIGGATGPSERLTFCEGGERLQLQIKTLQDAHCRVTLDTSIALTILPLPSTRITDTLCAGESLSIGGQVFDVGHPSDTVYLPNQAENGCDSLLVVDLTFLPIAYDTLRATLCREDSLLINGTVYNYNKPSGMETFVGQGKNTCDSLLYVSLSFYPRDTNFIRAVLCEQDSLELAGTYFTVSRPSGIVVLPNASAAGCDSIIDVQVTFVDQFTSEWEPSICPGDSLMVNGTIYNQFRLSGTEVFTSSAGCDSLVNINLKLHQVDTHQIIQFLCPGDSILMNGMVYNRENPQGIQVLEGASSQGCDSVIQVILEYLPEIRTTYQDTLCHLDSLVINGTVYHKGRVSGIEVFRGQGQNGCDSIVAVNLHFQEPIRAELTGTSAICLGEATSLQLALSGAERYDVFYQADNNPPVTLAGLKDGTSIPVQPMRTTVYQVMAVQDARLGCAGQPVGNPVTVSVSDIALELERVKDFNGFGVSCAGSSDGALRALVKGAVQPYTYLWNNGSDQATIENLKAGDYSLTLTDAAGCQDSIQQILEEPEPLQVDASVSSSTCENSPDGSIELSAIRGGVTPYQIELNGLPYGQVQAFPFVQEGLPAGAVELFLLDDNGCQSSMSLQIPEEYLYLDLGEAVELKIGDSLRLIPRSNFDLVDFDWQPLENLSDPFSARPWVSPQRTKTYTLTAKDTSGCRLSASVTIFVDQTRKVFAPTAFTPNEDGVNDRFTIFGGNDLTRIISLQVFDRWGSLLYDGKELRPNDDHSGWDGSSQGKNLPAGSYIYRAVLRFSNGDEQPIGGEVLLVR